LLWCQPTAIHCGNPCSEGGLAFSPDELFQLPGQRQGIVRRGVGNPPMGGAGPDRQWRKMMVIATIFDLKNI